MYMNKLTEFTINIFELNDDSRKFYEWFKTSNYINEFSIEINTDHEGTEILEVMQHNPGFNADALEEVYRIDTGTDDEFICSDCQNKLSN